MNLHLMAQVYEMKGKKERAVAIYRELLEENPNDKNVEKELRRLAVKSMNIKGINKDMYKFFAAARTKEELFQLERWLIGN